MLYTDMLFPFVMFLKILLGKIIEAFLYDDSMIISRAGDLFCHCQTKCPVLS